MQMIRRVSSRQRIVNWDRSSSDASSHSAMTADDDYQTCLSRVSSLESLASSSLHLGKRIRRVSLDQRQQTPSLTVQDLASDVQICIASFLTLDDARNLSCASRDMHALIQNESFLWKQWCFQQWPNLPRDAVSFVDESMQSTPFHKSNSAGPNYSKLLQERAISYPTCVGDDGTLPYRLRTRRTVFSALAPTKIQFTGTVGTGDRCIRSDEPMPQPHRFRHRGMFPFLCRGEIRCKPFCSPFVDSLGQIQLTPRLVAYFEVTITALPGAPQPNDCVAIGLSRRDFSTHGRMPGWDHLSYGYHGDDGGLFHNGGDMIRRFGPSFGPGDIVGCGLDYLHGGIFFTLNGEFLGYGWTQLNLDASFYPTIGVDTNSVLEANFGASAFSFDLANFCKEQRRQQLQQTQATR
jgi:hypothetical protein